MRFVDKNDKIKAFIRLGEPIFFEFGVGDTPKKYPSSLSVDIRDTPTCDVVGDAQEVLDFLPQSSSSGIYASHFIEHLDDLSIFLRSVVRACSDGASVTFIVPHFSNPFFYSDPTHRAFFGLYTFSYLASSCLFRRSIPGYANVQGLVLRDVRLHFRSYSPNFARHFFKKLIQLLVNSSRWSQEFYEEVFSWLIPCYEIEYSLIVQKP